MRFSKPLTYSLLSFVILASTPDLANAKNSKGHSEGYSHGNSEGKMKHHGMNKNNDGVITRNEWRGNDGQSFDNHDWNGDGVLSGNELKPGAHRPEVVNLNTPSRTYIILDRNTDGIISRNEWRNTSGSFDHLDLNRDGILNRDEFYNRSLYSTSVFSELDINNDARISRREWHSASNTFTRLDVNEDNLLSEAELTGSQNISLIEQLYYKIFPGL